MKTQVKKKNDSNVLRLRGNNTRGVEEFSATVLRRRRCGGGGDVLERVGDQRGRYRHNGGQQ